MKKSFRFYTAIWAICLALFHVLAFAAPREYSSSFWVGYVFILASYLGQLVCAYKAFQPGELKKLFYNIPLVRLSGIGLGVMFVASWIAMLIPDFPVLLSGIICITALAVNSIALLTAAVAIDAVEAIDDKVAASTSFIKSMTADAQNLMSRAKAPLLKEKCKKVYEALRYSDPFSNDQLISIEEQIKEEFDMLTDAVLSDDLDGTENAVSAIIILISDRNNTAKLLRQRGQ